jgi:hypothetical protein
MRCYRGMRAAPDSLPETGASARTLGARPGTDIPIDAIGDVSPRTGGMSVAPHTPRNLPPHRRPPEFGGSGRDPVFGIDTENLGQDLAYRPDPANPGGHGFIEPSRPMSQDDYQTALHGTRPLWSPAALGS